MSESPIRILLADQHALFREAMRTVLDAEEDLIVIAEARDALEVISEAERTLPHLAILDSDLPMSEAPRTTSIIKDRVPDCRVLVLSSRDDYRALIEILDAGASGYLTKASPLADLIQATRAVNRGEMLVPPRMLGPLLAALLRRRREQHHAYELVSQLTRREREVLALVAEGADNRTIAETLVISPQTARTHIQNILNKLSVHSRLAAAAFVTQNGIVSELVSARQ
jgi:NarL family two-component system response regulator LiaR